jgi:putative membrane protein
MVRLLLRLVLNAAVFVGVSQLVPGFHVSDWKAAAIASVVFGVVNAIIRPVLGLIALPFTIMSLGLVALLLNAAMMGLAAYLVPGFSIDGLVPALLGWLCVSVGSGLVSWVLKKD